MLASLRWLLWTVFLIGFVTAFWQYYEFAYTLTEHGIISSPVWSGAAGPPWLHHGITGFTLAGASITALTWERRRRERREEKPD